MSRLIRWLTGRRPRRMTLNQLLDANLKAGRLVYEWRI
jgi:hypothetical protein